MAVTPCYLPEIDSNFSPLHVSSLSVCIPIYFALEILCSTLR